MGISHFWQLFMGTGMSPLYYKTKMLIVKVLHRKRTNMRIYICKVRVDVAVLGPKSAG